MEFTIPSIVPVIRCHISPFKTPCTDECFYYRDKQFGHHCFLVQQYLAMYPTQFRIPEGISKNQEIHRRYLQTTQWKLKREAALRKANYKCLECGQAAEEVHHLTYERLGDELLSDLKPLCKACHADKRLPPEEPKVKEPVEVKGNVGYIHPDEQEYDEQEEISLEDVIESLPKDPNDPPSTEESA